MKILLVAATSSEIEPFLSRLEDSEIPVQRPDILITGVGMVATAYSMGRHLALNKYDLAINAGIAGSFDFNITLGEVVLVSEDIFAEQGSEDGENFLSLDDLGFGQIKQFPVDQRPGTAAEAGLNLKRLEKIKHIKAITVNKVHGHEFSISKTLSRYKAQAESMEGAAFFYACSQSGTPCIQIRSISNYVEPRNKEKWNIGLAVSNLNEFLISMFINSHKAL